MTQEEQEKYNRLAKSMLMESTVSLPDKQSEFTFRVIGDLDDDAYDFLIALFTLMKKHKCYQKDILKEHNQK